MRTHKIAITFNSEEAAKTYEEWLHADFCDLTHWYCGLDGAGEDTPDTCLIYRGIVHPEVITIELDLRNYVYATEEENLTYLKEKYTPTTFGHNEHLILSVEISETEWYKKIKELETRLVLH